ncbi:hypothetical protein [Streptomyces abyssomicinicus]|uniref:hypothetical protein n=1 Tax=Streptomyces abyssomicinicus TaxID=574929 RepID=UPI00124FDE81|nr:hypothetical protein [Streptomyces abyssomicinicus]
MSHLHHVRLYGPPEAHPESTAIRFIALLPATWQATITECHGTTALLQVTVPPAITPDETTRTLTSVLAEPVLQNWTCTVQ